MYIIFHIFFHYTLLQDTQYSFLCYTVVPCCLFDHLLCARQFYAWNTQGTEQTLKSFQWGEPVNAPMGQRRRENKQNGLRGWGCWSGLLCPGWAEKQASLVWQPLSRDLKGMRKWDRRMCGSGKDRWDGAGKRRVTYHLSNKGQAQPKITSGGHWGLTYTRITHKWRESGYTLFSGLIRA